MLVRFVLLIGIASLNFAASGRELVLPAGRGVGGGGTITTTVRLNNRSSRDVTVTLQFFAALPAPREAEPVTVTVAAHQARDLEVNEGLLGGPSGIGALMVRGSPELEATSLIHSGAQRLTIPGIDRRESIGFRDRSSFASVPGEIHLVEANGETASYSIELRGPHGLVARTFVYIVAHQVRTLHLQELFSGVAFRGLALQITGFSGGGRVVMSSEVPVNIHPASLPFPPAEAAGYLLTLIAIVMGRSVR